MESELRREISDDMKHNAQIRTHMYKGKWSPLFEERLTFNQLFLKRSLKMGTIKTGILSTSDLIPHG